MMKEGGRREEGEGRKKDEGREGYIIKEGRVDYIWKLGSTITENVNGR